jgi:UDP-GlcNAc:undecaprenyl-phosphate GlcNAc-1-phosphate transferase
VQSSLLLLLPFGVAVISWPLAKSIGLKFDIMDHPNHRKIHAVPTLRTGGLIILFAYIAGLFVSKSYSYPEFQPLILSVVSIFILGIIEDKHILGAKLRLVVQAGIACFFVLSTGAVLKDLVLFPIPWFLQVPFMVFAIVGVINAFNIIDGMNGLSSGLGIIASSSLGILAFLHGDNEVFTCAVLFVSALSGFMVFNIRGKIFMGDSGSYLTGLVVSALSVMLAVRNPDVSPFAPFLVVLIPVFDTLFSIYRRQSLRRDPFKADRRHLHHILARRYKSTARAVTVILLLQAGIALLAIFFHGQTYVLVGSAILFLLFLRRLWFRRISLAKVRWRDRNIRTANWFKR